MSVRSATTWPRLLLTGSLLVLGSGLLAGAARAQDSTAPLAAFTASAGAAGVSVQTKLPGFPLTDIPVDAGGPIAQVTAQSFGQTQGYAAFPAPGDLIITGPSLLRGLLATSLGGLPPIHTPELPAYPFFVQSTGGRPASVGEGPYRLEATSGDRTASATASAGLSGDVAGSVALVRSRASITDEQSGVVATASSAVEGLSVGPLAIGQVTSTATQTLASDGTVHSTTHLEISGARIAGLAVSLNPGTLDVAGTSVPVDLTPLFRQLLASAGLTVKLLPAQTFTDRVVSPALIVSIPVDISGVTSSPGTVSLTVGGATASITGATAQESAPSTVTTLGGAADISVPLGGSGTLPVLTPSVLAPAGQTPSIPVPVSRTAAAPPGPLLGLFDIKSAYLFLGACAAYVAGMGQLLRIMGVRRPWTSSAG